MIDIQNETDLYANALDQFIEQKELPWRWFEGGPDHLAIKAYNPIDYLSLIRLLVPKSELLAETYIRNRRIANAKLLGEHAIGLCIQSQDFGIDWIEVIEALPDDRSEEPPRFDHLEIYFPRGVIPINSALNRRGLHPLIQSNKAHAWSSVIFDEARELKFTDIRQVEIVQTGIANSDTKLISGYFSKWDANA